ncbi:MAG TPA: OsmC family protein [Methylomirabilota bacterium]|nr:OsmC family protein [Methylomirabilota bacterium]
MTTATTTQRTVNGLDTRQLVDTVNAIKTQPALARFQFRNRNRWVDGGENHSTIRDFYGAGREDDSRQASFEFVNGEPPVLLGHNEGANPVEFLLHALAGCVTTTFVLHATARGIRIESISTEMEGDIDLRGLLGLDDSVFPGYEQIRVKMDIQADCTDEELEDLLAYTEKHSPVCNSVCRPVPVVIERVARANGS